MDKFYNIRFALNYYSTVHCCLRAEAYHSRDSYRTYVKGYISALRDLGASDDSVAEIYDAFMAAEDEIFDIYEETTNS